MIHPGLFADTVDKDEINSKLKSGQIPNYVSSVSYGRIAIITIQSNYSRKDIENQIRLGSVKLLGAGFENDVSLLSYDKQTQMNVFVYGGSTENVYSSMITPSSPLVIANLFSNYDAKNSIGLPISYRLRNLDGTLASIQSVDEYVIKKG